MQLQWPRKKKREDTITKTTSDIRGIATNLKKKKKMNSYMLTNQMTQVKGTDSYKDTNYQNIFKNTLKKNLHRPKIVKRAY